MFATAVGLGGGFTFPVVISKREPSSGNCSAAIGSFVVINDEGWIVTANHIIKEIKRLDDEVGTRRRVEAEQAAIRSDASLDSKARSKRLKSLPKLSQTAATHFSVLWGIRDAQIKAFHAIEEVDLAFARLEPWSHPNSPGNYPAFKDPAKPMPVGSSLCRLGFPFHEVRPTFDLASNRFTLPPDSLPIPFFANEGILARLIEYTVAPPAVKAFPFALRGMETSNPGLRGQSGGPILDAKGAIWGIQTQTVHYPLGFSPPVPNSRTGEKEHQFLNVGRGVHAETIVGAMRDLNIAFALSEH